MNWKKEKKIGGIKTPKEEPKKNKDLHLIRNLWW